MKRLQTLTGITIGVFGVMLMLTSSPQANATPKADDNVTICHATASEHNPYTNPTVDPDSIVRESGHDSHDGDIIPPFYYYAKHHGGEDNLTQSHDDGPKLLHYDGKNWDDEGKAIWRNHCEPTDTTEPVVTDPVVTEPVVTDPKPVVTDPKPVVTDPSTSSSTIAPAVVATSAPAPTSTAEVEALAPTTVAGSALPSTGTGSNLLMAIGGLLLLSGITLVVATRMSAS